MLASSAGVTAGHFPWHRWRNSGIQHRARLAGFQSRPSGYGKKPSHAACGVRNRSTSVISTLNAGPCSTGALPPPPTHTFLRRPGGPLPNRGAAASKSILARSEIQAQPVPPLSITGPAFPIL